MRLGGLGGQDDAEDEQRHRDHLGAIPRAGAQPEARSPCDREPGQRREGAKPDRPATTRTVLSDRSTRWVQKIQESANTAQATSASFLELSNDRRDRQSRNEDEDAAQSAVVQRAPYDLGAGEKLSVRRPRSSAADGNSSCSSVSRLANAILSPVVNCPIPRGRSASLAPSLIDCATAPRPKRAVFMDLGLDPAASEHRAWVRLLSRVAGGGLVFRRSHPPVPARPAAAQRTAVAATEVGAEQEKTVG